MTRNNTAFGKTLPNGAAIDTDWQSTPIPADWIRSGQPTTRSQLLSRSRDGTTVTSYWDCTTSVFDWYFGCEETVYILEGAVHVTESDGTLFTLSAGDIAVFQAHTTARWDVPNYVKKLAICRQPVPYTVGLGLRVSGKLSVMLRDLLSRPKAKTEQTANGVETPRQRNQS